MLFRSWPKRPEVELNNIKAADKPPAILGPAIFRKRRSGVKKIPPPVPVSPESKPSIAPKIRRKYIDVSFTKSDATLFCLKVMKSLIEAKINTTPRRGL